MGFVSLLRSAADGMSEFAAAVGTASQRVAAPLGLAKKEGGAGDAASLAPEMTPMTVSQNEEEPDEKKRPAPAPDDKKIDDVAKTPAPAPAPASPAAAVPSRAPGAEPDGPVGPFTVMLFGDYGVGKTSVLTCFVTDGAVRAGSGGSGMCFDEITKAVAASPSGALVRLTLWDTAGAERHNSFMPHYMRKLDAAVLAYAIDDEASAQAIGKWQLCVAEMAPSCRAWYVIANKMDAMVHRGADVSERCARIMTDGMRLAARYGVTRFMSTSAVTGVGVAALFERVAADLARGGGGGDADIAGDDAIAATVRAHVSVHVAASAAPQPPPTRRHASSSDEPAPRRRRMVVDGVDDEERERLRREVLIIAVRYRFSSC